MLEGQSSWCLKDITCSCRPALALHPALRCCLLDAGFILKLLYSFFISTCRILQYLYCGYTCLC